MPGRDRALAAIRSQVAEDVAGLAGSRARVMPGAPRAASTRSAGGRVDVHVNVNLAGGVVFLDDERRMRLLAKEIKRLIMEDVRRGIAVGG